MYNNNTIGPHVRGYGGRSRGHGGRHGFSSGRNIQQQSPYPHLEALGQYNGGNFYANGSQHPQYSLYPHTINPQQSGPQYYIDPQYAYTNVSSNIGNVNFHPHNDGQDPHRMHEIMSTRQSAYTPIDINVMNPIHHHYQPQPPHPLLPPPLPNTRNRPPPTYCCHKCGKPGHWIQECNVSRPHPQNISTSHSQHPPVRTTSSTNPQDHHQAPPQDPHASPKLTTFQCDPCDKQFTVSSQLIAHQKTHIICSVPQCTFQASRRVVNAHYQTAHGQYSGEGLKEIDIEGQKFIVLVGNSPQDIAKWREERRNKWPKSGKDPKTPSNATNLIEIVPTTGIKRKHSAINDREDGEMTDECEDTIEEENETKDVQEPGESTANSSTKNPSKRKKNKSKPIRICKKYMKSGVCPQLATCRFSHDVSSIICRHVLNGSSCPQSTSCKFSHDHQKIKDAQQRKNIQDKDIQIASDKRTLLHKLLAKDIATDHRKMLQIINYIIQEQFFQ